MKDLMRAYHRMVRLEHAISWTLGNGRLCRSKNRRLNELERQRVQARVLLRTLQDREKAKRASFGL